MNAARGDFGRALAKYWGTRGGGPSDVTPVAIVDDAEQAYPPYRRWAAYIAGSALAANYTYLGIINSDARTSGSQLLIEGWHTRPGAAASVVLTPGDNLTAIPLSNLADVFDLAPEAGGQMGIVRLGTVVVASVQSTAVSTGLTLPYNDALVHSERIPIVIGPQTQALWRPSAVNIAFDLFVWGRYYSAL